MPTRPWSVPIESAAVACTWCACGGGRAALQCLRCAPPVREPPEPDRDQHARRPDSRRRRRGSGGRAGPRRSRTRSRPRRCRRRDRSPQRRPTIHARRCASTENGASAATWSGPSTQWLKPAARPLKRTRITVRGRRRRARCGTRRRAPRSGASARRCPRARPRSGCARSAPAGRARARARGCTCPGARSDPAPSMPWLSIRAPSRITEPMPTNERSSSVQACTMQPWPIVTSTPTSVASPARETWMMQPSCRLVRAPSRTWQTSPRTTQPNQTLAWAPTRTSPIRTAPGAAKASGARRGRWSR